MGIAYTSKCLDYTIYGKSEQKVTEQSKNLFNLDEVSYNRSNVVSYGKGSELNVNGTSTGEGWLFGESAKLGSFKAGTYTFKMTRASGNLSGTVNIVLRKADNTNIFDTYEIYNAQTFTLIDDAELLFDIYILGSNRIFDNLALNIQLEKGSQATSYVPFTPNSPSPDYPSEIKCVKGSNNLFDAENEIETQYKPDGSIATSSLYSLENGRIVSKYNNNDSGRRYFNKIKLPAGTYHLNAKLSQGGNYTTSELRFTVIDFTNMIDIVSVYTDIVDEFSTSFTLTKECEMSFSMMPRRSSDGILYIEDLILSFADFKTWLRVDDVGKNLFNATQYLRYWYYYNWASKGKDENSLIVQDFNGSIWNDMQTIFEDKIKANHTYEVTFKCDSENARVQIVNLGNLYSGDTFTATSDGTKFKFLADTYPATFTDIMIRDITTPEGYSPYFEPKTYFLPLDKKNFLELQDKETTTNGITYSVKDGIIKLKGTATASFGINFGTFSLKAGTYYFKYGKDGVRRPYIYDYATSSSIINGFGTFTLKEEKTRLGCDIYINNGDIIDLEYNPKIYEGPSSEDHYELCSTEDLSIRDKYIVENGYAKIEKDITKLVLDGTENIHTYSYGTNSYYVSNITRPLLDVDKVLLSSNCFVGISHNNRNVDKNNIIYIPSETERKIVFRNTQFDTLDSFKQFLKQQYSDSVPVVVYYVLEDSYTADMEQVDFPTIDGEIKGIAYNGKEVKGIAYNGEVIFESQV